MTKISYPERLWVETEKERTFDYVLSNFMMFAYPKEEGGIRELVFEYLLKEFKKEDKSAAAYQILTALCANWSFGKADISPFKYNKSGVLDFIKAIYENAEKKLVVFERESFLLFCPKNIGGYWWKDFILQNDEKSKDCDGLAEFLSNEINYVLKNRKDAVHSTNYATSETRLMNSLFSMNAWSNKVFQRIFFSNLDFNEEMCNTILGGVLKSNLSDGDLEYMLNWLNSFDSFDDDIKYSFVKNFCKYDSLEELRNGESKLFSVKPIIDAITKMAPKLEDSGVRDKDSFARNKDVLERWALMNGAANNKTLARTPQSVL